MSVRTNEDLLSKIKRKSFIPASQSTFTDDELLEIASEEMNAIIVPTILNAREEYFVYKDVRQLDGSVNPTFNIPKRAVGMQLREVSMTIGGTERNVPRYDLEDRVYENTGGYVYGFDIMNNQINLKGANRGDLNFYYYLRPGKLVRSNNARNILVVDESSRQVTLASVPSTWTTGTEFDIIKCDPGFDVKSINLTVASIDTVSNTVTFNEDLPSEDWRRIEAGDWLTVAETSPVPQLPVEWQEYLAQAVTAYIMESIGDADGFQRAEARKQELKKMALASISPRVDGQSKKIVPRRNRGAFVYDSQYRNY